VRLAFESPIATAGTAVTLYRDREDGAEYVYSLFVPSDASTVFPCFDQPDLKARFTLALEVPQAWEAVSNAPAIETIAGETTKRVAFRATEPISTYLFAFAAGPFEILDDREDGVAPQPEARMLVRKSRLKRAQAAAYEMFMLHRQAVDWFAGYFGFPFPFPKHDLVLVPEFPYGGMEHAGATFLREESVLFPFEPAAADRLRRAQLLFHETSHQWFGDLVTMRWFDDLWLKEGFANFMAAKATAAIAPEYPAWNAFHQLKVAAYRTDGTQGTTPIWQRLANLSSAKSAYGNIVYSKAPAVLRQAEFYLGADVFQRAVQGFVHSHAYGVADWNDLVRALEGASGRKLDAWADAWVKRRGMPVATGCAPAHGRDRGRLTLAGCLAEATASGRCDRAAGGRRGSAAPFRSRLEGRARARARRRARAGYVFANHGDYAYGRFCPRRRERAAVLADVGSVAIRSPRALLLDTLWTRCDARPPCSRVIDLALAQAPREPTTDRREPGRADADRAALVSLRRAARRSGRAAVEAALVAG
jgi:aminopeptidase N